MVQVSVCEDAAAVVRGWGGGRDASTENQKNKKESERWLSPGTRSGGER